jgi:hypothetical protein
MQLFASHVITQNTEGKRDTSLLVCLDFRMEF